MQSYDAFIPLKTIRHYRGDIDDVTTGSSVVVTLLWVTRPFIAWQQNDTVLHAYSNVANGQSHQLLNFAHYTLSDVLDCVVTVLKKVIARNVNMLFKVLLPWQISGECCCLTWMSNISLAARKLRTNKHRCMYAHELVRMNAAWADCELRAIN
jgi:hypothetical protein